MIALTSVLVAAAAIIGMVIVFPVAGFAAGGEIMAAVCWCLAGLGLIVFL
jgi:hypothetical protein